MADTQSRQFEYLLNAFEQASQSDKPAENGYADKRKALLAYVAALQSVTESAGQAGEVVDGPILQLAELMRGLEIPPTAATLPASHLYMIGKAIAGQAKEKNPPASQDAGMVMVPLKPTLAMLRVLLNAANDLYPEDEHNLKCARDAYKAMLLAATKAAHE